MFRDGPSDNEVAEFCTGLTAFPNTPLGMLAAVSDFTLSQYVRSNVEQHKAMLWAQLASGCARLKCGSKDNWVIL